MQHGIHVVFGNDVITQVYKRRKTFLVDDVIVKNLYGFIAPEPILLVEQSGKIAITQEFELHRQRVESDCLHALV